MSLKWSPVLLRMTRHRHYSVAKWRVPWWCSHLRLMRDIQRHPPVRRL
jgi:hypothetical protein